MNNKIIIVGAFHEIIELAEENGFLIVGLIDNVKKGNYLGYQIIGSDKDVKKINKDYPLIITPDLPSSREKLVYLYQSFGFKFTEIISNKAKISKLVTIGEGTIVQHGVNISCECIIGKFVKLNTNSNIMHNSEIGDFTTIAPNAVILGNVKIGMCSYIGANATILPNLTIGNNSIVGAGAVVTRNVEDNVVVIGNPARVLRKK